MAPSAIDGASSSEVEALDFKTFHNYINGKATDSTNHRHGINPATLEALPEVPIATKEDLDTCIETANVAFKKWRYVSWEDRKSALLKFADLMDANLKGFSNLLTLEQGKPTFQADFEAGGAGVWLRSIAEMKLEDEVLEDNDDRKVILRYTALGVVGAIVPWNFPILLAIGKIAPALLAGNTIIIKPSPFTPYCALKIAELAQQAFPPGVVSVLSDDDSLGPLMTQHPGIAKISFTGSTRTGKLVAASCAKTIKRVTLELGGKDPAVICANVNIPAVAAQVATFAFLNSGQICLAVKRIYIHKSIYNEFRQALVDHVKTLNVGSGLDSNTFCGPIQNDMQFGIVSTYFDDIEKEKWTVAVGGEKPEQKEKSGGYYIKPTIIDNPPEESRIVQEEPFGPILPILSWENEDEVIDRANGLDLGLGASVWSDDLEQAERIARKIESGTVWVNKHFDMDPRFPFGGHKQSGLGVEWGIPGLKGMCNSQTLNFNKKGTSG